MRLVQMTTSVVLGFTLNAESYAQESDSDPDPTTAQADGFFPDLPRERTFPPDLIRESGCAEEDSQCLELAAIRHALRLPEGFSREPDCIEDTVCVAETLSMRHDDFVAVLELVSPQIRPEWNIGMEDVLPMQVVLVTAESERQRNGPMEWIDGGKFLVEMERPGRSWSILRQQLYHLDLVPRETTENTEIPVR